MFPESNVWDAPPGPSRSVTKGLLFMLRPLSPGTHTLRVRGHHDELGEVDFTYRLAVGNSARALSRPGGRDAGRHRPLWGSK
jgi:hypothetical protein